MKLVVLSHFNLRAGSGYTTIAVDLVRTLAERGHDVKVLGFDYNGEEHTLPAAVTRCEPPSLGPHFRLVAASFKPDALISTADITQHVQQIGLTESGIPYVGIFPLESDPLMHPSEWTRVIELMAGALVETEWATKLCQDVGLDVRHIPIGIDTTFWRPPTAEERGAARQQIGVAEKWMVLTVADNHERKNLPAAMLAVALAAGREIEWPPASGRKAKKAAEWTDVHMVINTKRRPDSVGYSLWNLADAFQLQNETTFYQHEQGGGLGVEALRRLYWAADTFLLLSKAEGLGLPTMEAMACGVPCVCTDAGGMAENLAGERGWLVEPEYSYIDPFGNQTRRFASPEKAAQALVEVRDNAEKRAIYIDLALQWAKGRTIEKATDVLEEVLHGIQEPKTQEAGSSAAS